MTNDLQELVDAYDANVWFLPATPMFDKRMTPTHLMVLAAITNMPGEDGQKNGNRARAAQLELMGAQSPTFSAAGFWTNGAAQFLSAAVRNEALHKRDCLTLAYLDRWRKPQPPKLSQLARAARRSDGWMRKSLERLRDAGFLDAEGFPETGGLIGREPPTPEIPQ